MLPLGADEIADAQKQVDEQLPILQKTLSQIWGDAKVSVENGDLVLVVSRDRMVTDSLSVQSPRISPKELSRYNAGSTFQWDVFNETLIDWTGLDFDDFFAANRFELEHWIFSKWRKRPFFHEPNMAPVFQGAIFRCRIRSGAYFGSFAIPFWPSFETLNGLGSARPYIGANYETWALISIPDDDVYVVSLIFWDSSISPKYYNRIYEGFLKEAGSFRYKRTLFKALKIVQNKGELDYGYEPYGKSGSYSSLCGFILKRDGTGTPMPKITENGLSWRKLDGTED